MKIDVTGADWKEALCRRFLLSPKMWEELLQEAKQIAAERKLKANSARTQELLRIPPSDPRWSARQKEIDRLFAEHDKLLDIAYPRVKRLGGTP